MYFDFPTILMLPVLSTATGIIAASYTHDSWSEDSVDTSSGFSERCSTVSPLVTELPTEFMGSVRLRIPSYSLRPI
ncbi:hypothetical protein DFH05DRAFT_683310 [Lentinula detonsa]|uniref:Secreted protein n=1 Tax=Lentinula detonsa TaxID=2804962 RepID=A0A9W8U279_9AGAR|nr:hypothetical protein DFH05DRAFT_683310 [Lentinula detonsa]